MPVQMSFNFTSDRVTARTLNRIRRENNERAGKDIVQYVIPGKFKQSAYTEYPGVVRPRQKKYAAIKRKRVGHDIPNVLTGRLRDSLKASGDGTRVTATAGRGTVYIRVYWASKGKQLPNGKVIRSGIKESQRQELEAMSPQDLGLISRRMQERFIEEIKNPANVSNRTIRKARLGR